MRSIHRLGDQELGEVKDPLNAGSTITRLDPQAAALCERSEIAGQSVRLSPVPSSSTGSTSVLGRPSTIPWWIVFQLLKLHAASQGTTTRSTFLASLDPGHGPRRN